MWSSFTVPRIVVIKRGNAKRKSSGNPILKLHRILCCQRVFPTALHVLSCCVVHGKILRLGSIHPHDHYGLIEWNGFTAAPQINCPINASLNPHTDHPILWVPVSSFTCSRIRGKCLRRLPVATRVAAILKLISVQFQVIISRLSNTAPSSPRWPLIIIRATGILGGPLVQRSANEAWFTKNSVIRSSFTVWLSRLFLFSLRIIKPRNGGQFKFFGMEMDVELVPQVPLGC